jgi:di/tricarboxylate transporter
MSLSFHISIHFLSGLLAGYFVWKLWKKPLPAFLSSFLGAVVIDFDHFIDYFLAFGFNFKLNYFTNGYQFLKTDKIYILFHGWEYAIIFLILGLFIFKNKTAKTIFFALALGMLFHLTYDVSANAGMRFRSYSIIYRAKNNFNLEKAVTPKHWIDHQSRKGILQTL